MPIKSFLARRTARRHGGHRKMKTHIASRVVIRKPLSWQKRMLWGGLIACAALLTGIGLFLAGQYSVGHDGIGSALRIRDLIQENGQFRSRSAELSAALEATTTQLRIEQGARKSMEGQLLKLEEERNRLNRDLALFDNLFPSNAAGAQPTIRGFRIEPASGQGAWRYRLLIMRPGQAGDSFVGDIQMQVRYRQDGRDVLATSPAAGNISERLEFQRYQRVEGHFQAPAGAKLLGAIARVMENGRLVAESVYRP
jgi:hypothetical protein